MTRENRLWYNPMVKNKIIFICGIILGLTSVPLKSPSETRYSLEDKIGQMLLLGFRGTEITPDLHIVRILKDVPLGGVILFDYDVPAGEFPRNILNPRQTRELVSSLQSLVRTPLLIAVDAEGGRVNRLKPGYGFKDVPSPEEAARKNPNACRKIYSGLAEQLSSLGINLNLAPVVDVNINPENPVIGSLGRSFSSQPETVVEKARIFIQAHRRHHVLTALKHFPGHGSSRQDTHKGMTDITETFQKKEFIPFRKMIEEDMADAVMTAHVIHRGIDPHNPATLSSRFIRGILRDEWGYSGVVISDDLQMKAVLDHFTLAEAAVKAVQAGCDLLAVSNNSSVYDKNAAYTVRNALVEAVKEGSLSPEAVNRSFKRIMKLKKSAGIR